jgi:hypothetical protein
MKTQRKRRFDPLPNLEQIPLPFEAVFEGRIMAATCNLIRRADAAQARRRARAKHYATKRNTKGY